MARTTKKAAQRDHARRRARERYGVDVPAALRDTLLAMIRKGQCTLVEKQSNRVSVFDIKHDGATYRVVYDRNTKELATFLPHDVPVERYRIER
jgi:hypothetical protein